MGENAYKIELLRDMQIFVAFNVGDLTPYLNDNEKSNQDFRTNPLQRGGVNAKQAPSLDLF